MVSKDTDVNGEYSKTFRLRRGLVQRDCIGVIKDRYPKFSKPLIAACENEDYGVTLRKGAYDDLKEAYSSIPEDTSESPKTHRPEQRERAVVRFDKVSWRRLERACFLIRETRAEFIRTAVARRVAEVLSNYEQEL